MLFEIAKLVHVINFFEENSNTNPVQFGFSFFMINVYYDSSFEQIKNKFKAKHWNTDLTAMHESILNWTENNEMIKNKQDESIPKIFCCGGLTNI